MCGRGNIHRELWWLNSSLGGGQRRVDSKQGESHLQKSRGCDSDPQAPSWGWSIREGMPCTVACSGCCDKHRLAARTRHLFHTALGEESPRPGLRQAGPSEASLPLAGRQPPSPVSSHARPHVYVCVLISFPHRATSSVGLQPLLKASFYLNYLLKGPISKYITLVFTASIYEFCGSHNSGHTKTLEGHTWRGVSQWGVEGSGCLS